MSNDEITIPQAIASLSKPGDEIPRRTVRAHCQKFLDSKGGAGIPCRKIGRDWLIESQAAFEAWVKNYYTPRYKARKEKSYR